ncbi:MAG TPA: TraR/DksA C4-type zinc finger protein [Gaiellaceae bacterium]|nr:TraR/DksA C4-type zinc finger protein [Gaiellaceae bacterium]
MSVDTQYFRGILEEERQRVLDAISYLHEETPGSLAEETEEVAGTVDNHLGETATATLDREIDYSLEENSEQVLKAIEGALERIDEGTFGICQTCREPISEERLEAIPYATQCIDCRRKGERR